MLEGWIGLPKDAKKRPPIEVLSDCNSLVETMQMIEPTATEKRLRLDLYSLKENLNNKTIEAMKWVDTRIQIADALTKSMDPVFPRRSISIFVLHRQ